LFSIGIEETVLFLDCSILLYSFVLEVLVLGDENLGFFVIGAMYLVVVVECAGKGLIHPFKRLIEVGETGDTGHLVLRSLAIHWEGKYK
jgi:hypothetical protein